MQVIEAVIKNGQIVPVSDVDLEEGSRVLVTLSNGDSRDFWLVATERSLKEIWNNDEDDVYAELLEK